MTAISHPRLVILAGPNGAGKSAIAPELLGRAMNVTEFVNADVIAAGMSAFHPESVALAARRVMLARMHELAAAVPESISRRRSPAARSAPGSRACGREATESNSTSLP